MVAKLVFLLNKNNFDLFFSLQNIIDDTHTLSPIASVAIFFYFGNVHVMTGPIHNSNTYECMRVYYSAYKNI